jgi:hypothetical protein
MIEFPVVDSKLLVSKKWKVCVWVREFVCSVLARLFT